MRRLVALAVASVLVLSACAFLGGGAARGYKAEFSRAVQLFPGGRVRVLGVDVGVVTDVRNVGGGVEVSFRIDDPDIQLPADVRAAIVPMSLLGERYVQLFPAYRGGPTFPPGSTIGMERTAVPAEPDELLRSLQDYLGALDPDNVSAFVENAATLVDGSGQELNSLIHRAASVLTTLSSKREDLAQIVVEFDRLSRALATRKESMARLIHTYNTVAGTLTGNRAALEGTIRGLNDASAQLASLLIDHRRPLHDDVQALTRTGRTLNKNAERLARTGHWARRLFRAASLAVNFDEDWLRLNNQGDPLAGLIVMRLEERLTELCADLGLASCTTSRFWAREVPSLFCFSDRCAAREPREPQEELATAIAELPTLAERLLERARALTCEDATDRARCLQRKRILLRCADARNPEGCLKRQTVRLRCATARDVDACLDRQRDREVGELVEDLLDRTLSAPTPGGLP